MNTYNFCELLKKDFGKFYENVTNEKIDNIQMPVYFDGVNFESLHPKDTVCDISYIREPNAANVQMIDLGGCDKKPFYVGNFRFVYYSNTYFNHFAKMQLFIKKMQGINIIIQSIDTDFTRVYNAECGKNKLAKIKGGCYMAIDFTLRKKVDICTIIEC